MSKLNKGITLLKKGIKDPALIGKGLKYLKNNGWSGFEDNLKGREDYEQALDEVQRQELQSCDGDILFSVLMPVYNVELRWLQLAVESVKNQTYRSWELCIADDCSTDGRVRDFLKKVSCDKIKVCFCEKNRGISEATNQAAAMAAGDYLVLMDNDDVIAPFALKEFYYAIKKSSPDLLYSDQDIINESGERSNPFLKPDWSPDLLLSQMYLGHLLGFRKELFEKAGGFRSEYNGSQDYDLALRMTEQTTRIAHVPKILYSWRSLPSSTAENPEAKPYAQTAGQRALQDHMDRVLGPGKARADETENLFVYDVRYLLEQEPLVSIIMPTKDHMELTSQAVDSILEKTEYKNYELLILDNNSEEAATKKLLAELENTHENIRVIDAPFPFNWSRLNNFGMKQAKGDVFVFLNNDIQIIEGQWLTRLAELSLRPQTGVVGGLLLYEDETIQHGGVVVGMGGWADHVYKGMQPVHFGAPFLSPMVTRNVLACTGACMGVSRRTIEKIGPFDERFIICGSDVELCVRAYEKGLFNVYSPYVRMYHYESKTRDSYVPPVDLKYSYRTYEEYLKHGDPFYHVRLDLFSCAPRLREIMPEVEQIMRNIGSKRAGAGKIPAEFKIGEINPYRLRLSYHPRKRLNLLVPSVNTEHVFGGISTALKFFDALCEASGFDRRLIVVDAQPSEGGGVSHTQGYQVVEAEENSDEPRQLVPYSWRGGRSIPVSEQDYFVFTGWWTAHCMQEAYEELEKDIGIRPNLFLYLIQDFEPGFYPWSSKYLLADATYRHPYPMAAVFNSSLLKEHFDRNGYEFAHSFVFEPVLNDKLKEHLKLLPEKIEKKKQILIYGRPGTQRNAFELILASLQKWIQMRADAGAWRILSAGEEHPAIELGQGIAVTSLGKLSIGEYARILQESYAGISLMASPHPSYPPLEMAVFGVKVITNTFLNKDLSGFHPNIRSVKTANPSQIAQALSEICDVYEEQVPLRNGRLPYIENTEVFRFTKDVAAVLKGE